MLKQAMSRHALAAQAIDLQRPQQTLWIIKLNPPRRLRVYCAQLLVQRQPAITGGLCLQLRTQRLVSGRHIRQPFQ